MLKEYLKKQGVKKTLMPFYEEIKSNLEKFYVMDQRQFVDSEFSLKAWQSLKTGTHVDLEASVDHYAHSLMDFNEAYKSYREFEQWYISDENHKTPDNARTLHARKAEVSKKMKGLDEVIVKAGADVERQLIKQGIIKA